MFALHTIILLFPTFCTYKYGQDNQQFFFYWKSTTFNFFLIKSFCFPKYPFHLPPWVLNGRPLIFIFVMKLVSTFYSTGKFPDPWKRWLYEFVIRVIYLTGRNNACIIICQSLTFGGSSLVLFQKKKLCMWFCYLYVAWLLTIIK